MSNSHMHDDSNYEEGEYDDDSPTLFKLSGIDNSLSDSILEDTLNNLLSIQITLLERNYNGEEGTILFCCCDDDAEKSGQDDNYVIETIDNIIQIMSRGGESPESTVSIFACGASNASIAIVDEEDDEECVEYITEEEAYQFWLEQNRCGDENDNNSETHLVSSPDGTLVRPKHRKQGSLPSGPDSNVIDDEEKKCDIDALDEESVTTPPMACITARQLKRDPGLLEFDNVLRVHYSEVMEYLSEGTNTTHVSSNNASMSDSQLNWKENFGSQPIILHGLGKSKHGDSSTETFEAEKNKEHNYDTATVLPKELKEFQTALRNAILQHGTDTIVRTGNRETLVKNGFHNSKPETLSEVATALLNEGGSINGESDASETFDGTIIFNPIHEMPPVFRSETLLGRWVTTEETTTKASHRDFPNRLWNVILNPDKQDNIEDGCLNAPKFTLCMANEGFGIGMHQHGPALFFLTEGRKKWYLSHPALIDASQMPTHPGFYKELSTHKCIQKPGELLLVPNLWYHEIYNLKSPTIGIQALAEELPVP